MKVVGGLYLWLLILVIFTHGVRESDGAGATSKFRGRLVTKEEIDARSSDTEPVSPATESAS